MSDESTLVSKGPCSNPKCGSSDACATYDDGHTYCFSCGEYTHGDGAKPKTRKPKVTGLVDGEVQALTKRGITEETCKKWKYQVGKFKGKAVQIANYCDENGVPVAQKLRFANKDFLVTGDRKALGLYGKWLWRDGGKMVVVTEGEIDALTVSQLQQNKWPVVSVPNGAQGAAKSIKKDIEWLEKFDKVIFMFDDDGPGREAVAECAPLLSPGKAFVARIPGYKDANEALTKGQGAKVIEAIWGAKEYRPDGIVEIDDDFIDSIDEEVERGLPWCFPTLDKVTYGRRYGEVYALGAGTGIGKTDFLTQQIAYDVSVLGMDVGVFFLEQKPRQTAVRIAGKLARKRFHIPGAGWTESERKEAMARLKGKVKMYDSFGETEWEVVKAKMRYMAVAQGVRLFYLDHLTAMADTANEKESLEQIMKEMAGFANELNIIIHFVSHLATPDGKPHEEGGRVMIRHFKGSRAIGFWSFLMIGLERDQQHENEERRKTTIVRILKDRFSGQATGVVFGLAYDEETGRLEECEIPAEEGVRERFPDDEETLKDF